MEVHGLRIGGGRVCDIENHGAVGVAAIVAYPAEPEEVEYVIRKSLDEVESREMK